MQPWQTRVVLIITLGTFLVPAQTQAHSAKAPGIEYPAAHLGAAPNTSTAATAQAFRTKAYAAPVALILSLLLLAAFFDPRRPLRVLHLDLVVLLGFAVPHALYRGGAKAPVALMTFPLLVYLLGRMLYLGFRGRLSDEQLLPIVRARWLMVALALLIGLRVGLNIADTEVADIGYASVVGADRISKGQSIYEGDFPPLIRPGYVSGHGDTYGPLMYYAYIPFEQVFSWSGSWDSLPAAHAAAIAFDLFTLLGLFVLGRTIRPGGELAVALAFAWASYPYSFLILFYNTNDALMSALLVWALVLLTSVPKCALMLALATAAKIVPAALAPLLAMAPTRRPREVVGFSVIFIGVVALLLLPLLPDGGIREVYDRTLGFQADRTSPFTLWSLFPSLDRFRPIAVAAAIALAIVVAFVPRVKSQIQVAALGAAVLIAIQLAHGFWFVLYIPWWAPFVFTAVLGRYASSLQAFTVATGLTNGGSEVPPGSLKRLPAPGRATPDL